MVNDYLKQVSATPDSFHKYAKNWWFTFYIHQELCLIKEKAWTYSSSIKQYIFHLRFDKEFFGSILTLNSMNSEHNIHWVSIMVISCQN